MFRSSFLLSWFLLVRLRLFPKVAVSTCCTLPRAHCFAVMKADGKLKCTEVIVHSGGVSSGHYYTFVRVRESCFLASSRPMCWLGFQWNPSNPMDNPRWVVVYWGEGKSQWIKFDDDAWQTPQNSREKTTWGIHVLNIGVAGKDANFHLRSWEEFATLMETYILHYH